MFKFKNGQKVKYNSNNGLSIFKHNNIYEIEYKKVRSGTEVVSIKGDQYNDVILQWEGQSTLTGWGIRFKPAYTPRLKRKLHV